MATLARSDLKYEYKWTVTSGDNAKLIHDDAKHLSRKEGYEMLLFLNKLGISDGKFVYGSGVGVTKGALLKIEWMLKEKFESTAPGRETVVKWINDNWEKHRGTFASLTKK